MIRRCIGCGQRKEVSFSFWHETEDGKRSEPRYVCVDCHAKEREKFKADIKAGNKRARQILAAVITAARQGKKPDF